MRQHRKAFTQWTLPELIDLQGQCWMDRDIDPATLERRDRNCFQNAGLDASADASDLLKHWLTEMQRVRPLEPSPGRLFMRATTILSLFLCLLAVSAGVSATLWTLRYDGTVPVNVSVFLGLLIAPQLLMLAGYLPLLLLAWVRGSLFARAYALPSNWLRSLLNWLWHQPWLHERTSAQGRDRAKILSIGLQSLLKHHGAVVANRLFGLFQLSGVVFNLAVLGCMVLLLLFTDRAFGWQSSLVDSPENVHALVKVLSSPWSWLAGETVSHPSLEQIIGSRIVLRESGAMLESTDLLAWWPFLLACVLVYGLLPRGLVWMMTRWNESRMLARLKFERFEEASIVERMKSVEWNLQGRVSKSREADERSATPLSAAESLAGREALQVVVLQESFERYGEQVLQSTLAEQWEVAEPKLQVVKRLSEPALAHPAGQGQVLLLLEGWQPPIQERLNELASLARRLRDSEQSLVILLLGKPAVKTVQPLSTSMRTVWQQKLRLLSLPNLRLAPDPQSEMIS